MKGERERRPTCGYISPPTLEVDTIVATLKLVALIAERHDIG